MQESEGRPVARARSHHDSANVNLNRLLDDSEVGGDLGVRRARGQDAEDLLLRDCQVGHGLPFVRRRR